MEKDLRDEIENCIEVLQGLLAISEQHAALTEEQRVVLLKAAGQLFRLSRGEFRKRKSDIRELERQYLAKKERRVRASTGIRAARESTVFTAPTQITMAYPAEKFKDAELNFPRNCYVCKKEYTRLHFFYDALCPDCAELNYQKRFQTASLEGQVALITGSRFKIGYQATLLMLRAGATVIATTRFPIDSALRYTEEKDFTEWKNRL